VIQITREHIHAVARKSGQKCLIWSLNRLNLGGILCLAALSCKLCVHVQVLGTLRIIDKTLIDVHTMLVAVVKSLVEGGQTGVFTPMYMLCFEKPVSP
jgi:hypothetical protein